jgi:hypothetical protein
LQGTELDFEDLAPTARALTPFWTLTYLNPTGVSSRTTFTIACSSQAKRDTYALALGDMVSLLACRVPKPYLRFNFFKRLHKD